MSAVHIHRAVACRLSDGGTRHRERAARLPLLFGPDAHGRGASASLRSALAGGAPVVLFPNEYRTPLHAMDAAQALVAAAHPPDKQGRKRRNKRQ